MPLLKEVAERLSQDELMSGLIEEIYTEDDLFNVLDFRGLSGKSLVYNRELALPEADFYAPNDPIAESGGTVEEITVVLRAILGDVDVDSFLDETMGDTNDQTALQVGMKTKAVARKFRHALINGAAFQVLPGNVAGAPAGFIVSVDEVSDNHGKGKGYLELDADGAQVRYTAPGDVTPGAWVPLPGATGQIVVKSEMPSKYIKLTLNAANKGAADVTATLTATESKSFTGLKHLVVPSQTIEAGPNGADLNWDLLDQLADKVKGGPATCYLMNERTIRSYKALLRVAGGTDSAMLQLPNFGRPVLTLNGAPVLKSEFVLPNEPQGAATNTVSVYAVRIGQGGFQGLFGGPSAGIRVQPVGTVQDKDAERYRVKWYAGTALYSTLSVARLKGIKN
jgi:hypothetical protein